VHVAVSFSHIFRNAGEERYDIMLDFFFDFIDASDIEFCFLFYFGDCRCGNFPSFCLRLTGQNFYFKPDVELVLWLPDFGQFGKGISRNQRKLLFFESG